VDAARNLIPGLRRGCVLAPEGLGDPHLSGLRDDAELV
jgi:hypothetical protein